MKRMMLAVFAAVSLAGVGTLSAQQGIRVGVGGGLLMPMGDYNTADKPGWVAGADFTYWLTSSPVGIRLDGSYSQTKHDGIDGDSKIFGGMAEIVYAFGTQADPIRPYVLGGVGFFNVKVTVPSFSVDTSVSKVGFGGGAGVAFKVGSGNTRVFVEGKYVNVSTEGGSTTFLPIRAGIRFGGSSK